MAADGSNIPRIKPGDNIEAVNTALSAVERSLSEVREAAAAGKATADIVANLDNSLKAMKAEQAELVQRIAARDAAATDYGHDSDLALYVRGRGEEPRLRSVTDGGAPIQRTPAELKAHKAVRLFGEDSETYGFQPGLLDDPAPKCEWQRSAQVAYEEVAIAELCTGRTAAKARARLARLFSVAPNPEIKRLFSDASGTGTEWIPSEVVMPELERDLMLQTRGRVAGLFGVTPMSSKTVSSPFLSGGLRPYLKGAQTADDPARYTASTATTAERSRTAVGMAVRAQLDDDTTEDAVVDSAPVFRELVIQALLDGEEDAILNGDTAASHQDAIASWDIRGRWGTSGLGTSADHRRAWIGLRARAYDVSSTADLNSTQTFAGFLSQRGALTAPHGTVGNLVWLIPDEYYIKKVLGFAEVVTLEKYGPGATIMSGEVGKAGGARIMITQFLSADLATTGLYTGSGSTSSAVLVNVDRFKRGLRRGTTVEIARDATRGVRDVVATLREVFYSLDGSATKNVHVAFNLQG